MRFSRGPIRTTKTDMKSTCIALKAKRIQGTAFMQAEVVEVDFVSYLPIRNQLLALTIRKVRDGGTKVASPIYGHLGAPNYGHLGASIYGHLGAPIYGHL